MYDLFSCSFENLRKDGSGTVLDNGEIEIVAGDGRSESATSTPLYVIYVGAASPKVTKALRTAQGTRAYAYSGDGRRRIHQVDKVAMGMYQRYCSSVFW